MGLICSYLLDCVVLVGSITYLIHFGVSYFRGWKSEDATESNCPRKTIWFWTWPQQQQQQQQHPAHGVFLILID